MVRPLTATATGDRGAAAEPERRFRAQQAARPAVPRSLAQRRADLDALESALKAHQQRLVEALDADFSHRARQETLLAEVIPVLHEIRFTRRRLRRWMRPRRASVGWQLLPASARVMYQPLGIVGIVAPWNYPLNLSLWPLVSALAAGNQVMIKPSEHAPHAAVALRDLLLDAFPAEQVCVVTGGAEVAAAFCALPFDHLLFTGSARIARQVMSAAAANLTPVTLELGGKTPTIVDRDYPLASAVERILTGKLLNAGQTCVAPDYVLLEESRLNEFIELAGTITRRLYPEFENNPDYTSIINEPHDQRLRALLEDAREKGARLVSLGPDEGGGPGRMVPRLVINPTDEMRLMQEEIFGPVLPIVTFSSLDEAIAEVNRRPHPLALYYFGLRRSHINRVLQETRAGGVAINDVVVHVAVFDMPFGGIGPSGMGQYHGHAGFLTFSKHKGVFRQRRWSPLSLLRPPYGSLSERMLRFLIG